MAQTYFLGNFFDGFGALGGAHALFYGSQNLAGYILVAVGNAHRITDGSNLISHAPGRKTFRQIIMVCGAGIPDGPECAVMVGLHQPLLRNK